MNRFLPLALVLLVGSLAACDTMTDAAGPDAAGGPTAERIKLRHWTLVDRATRTTANKSGESADSVDFVVTFSDLVTDPEAAAAELFTANTILKRSYYRDSFVGVAVTADADELYDVLNDIIDSDSVAFVEPDIPLDPITEQAEYVDLDEVDGYSWREWHDDQLRPWSIKRIEGDDSSARSGNSYGSVDIDVYVIDGPVAHADLNVVERRSFLPAGVTPASPLHGTHVAGIIAAIDDSDGLVGVAPGARIHSLEVLDASGATTLSTLLSAVEYVTAQKLASPATPMVANMSIGMNIGTTELNALDEAVQKAVEAGVVFVVSAGNGSADARTYSPAHTPGAITVASSDPYDHFSRTFSNFGGVVDLLAPGTDVLSLADGDGYAVLSGTSMAAPHVAGAAALVLAERPYWSPARVLDEIEDEAKTMSGSYSHRPPSGTTRDMLRVDDL